MTGEHNAAKLKGLNIDVPKSENVSTSEIHQFIFLDFSLLQIGKLELLVFPKRFKNTGMDILPRSVTDLQQDKIQYVQRYSMYACIHTFKKMLVPATTCVL